MDTLELQKLKNKFDIVGNDAALNHALETAVAVAPTDLTVLITGESGVGKEAIPRIIHQYSRRRNGKFLAVNCGAIPEGTINAELFGHEKGAFTGAVGERKGYFEEANGGTLFLDEIGELPKETQAMLLRVLQNGEYIKVGSSKIEKTDVRIITATNVDLAHAVAMGKFREDLYYRLNAIQLLMPALRERRDDIYLLFRKFTADFSEKYGLCKIALTHDAILMLNKYRWPGNVRQLKNVTETITALESRPVTPGSDRIEIGPDRLAQYIPDEKDSLLPATLGGQGTGMSDSDKQMIVKAILDLKQEVDRLRGIVESGGAPAHAAPAHAAPVHSALPATNYGVHYAPDEPEEQGMVEEQPQEQDLSLRKANDDIIERALARHGGKVKLAAAELGISERTIYRKLAEKKGR
ncbi:MAG: sigma-54-dependent Fis family transcriptional regulator [Bacteroidales bacterium]|nr:sigma-54-dependent Fis family transcriptional regulator [Bacteroidales bacterium]